MRALLVPLAATLAALQLAAQPRQADPVLEFPEAGMDDTAAYQGYRTRFFRDSHGNTVQLYVRGLEGRVVFLWADAANESVGFTARDSAGRPLSVSWGSATAIIGSEGSNRSIEVALTVDAPRVELGWFLLASMRVERDLQYERRHLQPFDGKPFPRPELDTLIANLGRLGPSERARQLELLRASSLDELRARTQPPIVSDQPGLARVEQRTFDGRNRLAIEILVDTAAFRLEAGARTVSIHSRSGAPVRFAARVTTDAAPLTPIAREELFNRDFLRFFEQARAGQDASAVRRFRWLDRQARGLELVSSREKLMAGLPNFATYFGRDMMMSALMFESIWSEGMLEHVIASVLRKLAPSGEVSHEEALGDQAIRENAAEYNAEIGRYLAHRRQGRREQANAALMRARALIADLQRTRENYHMLDDDFQLPVLVARYLTDLRVSDERKRAFLSAADSGGVTRATLLIRNLAYVARAAAPYARSPVATRLVGFPRLRSGRWRSASWRDSGVGYANGRWAMDINVIWVPQALDATGRILDALETLGFAPDALLRAEPPAQSAALRGYAGDRELLGRAIKTWRGTASHFTVGISPSRIRSAVRARLAAMPAEERRYWEGVIASTGADRDGLVFLALSLDATGRPIEVANTDPATQLFLEDVTGDVIRGARSAAQASREIDAITRQYPVGLYVQGLGPMVANDAYAPPRVWEEFSEDAYHGPRVVWGREVNLILLGLARQITSAYDPAGRLRDPRVASYVQTLRGTLARTMEAVEASGLKHNELWSYRIEGDRLFPIRYGSSSDVQLWNLTDLAVQYVLSRLPPE